MENKQILVLDDDPDIRELIQMALMQKGYTVLLSETPARFYEKLNDNSVDVILLDMLLSGANGLDVCKSLKSQEDYKHIPVIMFSAHPKAKALAKQAGTDAFIEKPFDLKKLYDLVSSYV